MSYKLGTIRQPSEQVMFADSGQMTSLGLAPFKDLLPPRSVYFPNGTGRALAGASVHGRHLRRRANVAWVDGHCTAEAVKVYDTQSESQRKAALGFLDPNGDDVRENLWMFVQKVRDREGECMTVRLFCLTAATLGLTGLCRAAVFDYTIDPSRSTINITGESATGPIVGVFTNVPGTPPPAANVNPINANGFAARYSGTLSADVTAGSFQLLASAASAQDLDSYTPGLPTAPPRRRATRSRATRSSATARHSITPCAASSSRSATPPPSRWRPATSPPPPRAPAAWARSSAMASPRR